MCKEMKLLEIEMCIFCVFGRMGQQNKRFFFFFFIVAVLVSNITSSAKGHRSLHPHQHFSLVFLMMAILTGMR